MIKNEISKYVSEEDATFSIDPAEILYQHGDEVSALLYATLFFPDFVEVDGSVLRKRDDEDYQQRFLLGKLEAPMTLAALEASFNSVEIAYLFRPADINSSVVDEKLAHIVRDAWAGRLKQLYPARTFDVSVIQPEESGSVHLVEIFEIRECGGTGQGEPKSAVPDPSPPLE